MSILNSLNEKFSLDVFEGPSTQEEIDEMLASAPFKIPEEYLEIIREKTELEICVDGKKYIRIWGAKDCTEDNEAYLVQEYMPNAWVIGDDEGGSAILYSLENGAVGLYATGFGCLDDEEKKFLAPSLYDFFVKGIGIETYLSF